MTYHPPSRPHRVTGAEHERDVSDVLAICAYAHAELDRRGVPRPAPRLDQPDQEIPR